MYKIYKPVELSLIAFNGSKNCDHTTSAKFLESYIKRKKEILGDLHFKLSNYTSKPEKRLEDYKRTEFLIKYIDDNEWRVLDFIKRRFFK